MMGRETVELRPPLRADATQPVDIYAVSPGFLETLGIALTRGRDFQEADGAAVVVSQSLANLFWPRQTAIGKSLPLPGGAVPVVGVARDVAPMRFGGSDNPAAYRLRRVDAHNNFMSVRFDVGASRGGPAVRAASARVRSGRVRDRAPASSVDRPGDHDSVERGGADRDSRAARDRAGRGRNLWRSVVRGGPADARPGNPGGARRAGDSTSSARCSFRPENPWPGACCKGYGCRSRPRRTCGTTWRILPSGWTPPIRFCTWARPWCWRPPRESR